MNTKITTKFGIAKINKDGYYQITSRKEGNNNKFLHRLIWETVWGKIPKNWVIHHIDGNKTNNCILNLLGMDRSGENHPMYNKSHSIESCQKMSNSHNTTGFFRVNKHKDKRYSQGFIWVYSYYKNGKRHHISRVSLTDLKKEVIAKNLVWHIINEYNARITCKENDYNFEELS